MTMTPEIYVSIDIETDGPTPGVNSMLSLGAYAVMADGTEVGRFYSTMYPLPDMKEDPKTMEWWGTQPEAWAEVTKNRHQAGEAISEFHTWLKSLPGAPVFVAYPVAFDVPFVFWYLKHFVGECPVGFQAIDIRSFIMGMTGRVFHKTRKKDLPYALRPKGKHTHSAIDDAIEQGQWFLELMRENK